MPCSTRNRRHTQLKKKVVQEVPIPRNSAKSIAKYFDFDQVSEIVEGKIVAIDDLEELLYTSKYKYGCWRMPIIAGVKVRDNYLYYYATVHLDPKEPTFFKTFLWCHLVKFWAHKESVHDVDAVGKYIFFPELRRNQVDLSHLCHVADCCHPDHLVFEPEWINLERKKCVKGKKCLGHSYNGKPLPDCVITVTTLLDHKKFTFRKHDNPNEFVLRRKLLLRKAYRSDLVKKKVIRKKRGRPAKYL